MYLNVDGSASTQFRITVLPDSNDVIPVRNQLLEIDTVNTSVIGTVDQTATTGRGYTVTTTGSTTGTEQPPQQQSQPHHLLQQVRVTRVNVKE